MEGNRAGHIDIVSSEAQWRGNPHSPPQIAEGSTLYMDLYLKGILPDTRPCREFLHDVTMPFLERVEGGFLHAYMGMRQNSHVISETDRRNYEMMRRTIERSNSVEAPDGKSAAEAFGFSVATFGMMPFLATHENLPGGFSRRGRLAPPFTTREFLLRIREAKSEVGKVVMGITPQGIDLFSSPPLHRTHTFFKVGGSIPMLAVKLPGIVDDATRVQFEHLLGDIAMDLPPSVDFGQNLKTPFEVGEERTREYEEKKRLENEGGSE